MIPAWHEKILRHYQFPFHLFPNEFPEYAEDQRIPGYLLPEHKWALTGKSRLSLIFYGFQTWQVIVSIKARFGLWEARFAASTEKVQVDNYVQEKIFNGIDHPAL